MNLKTVTNQRRTAEKALSNKGLRLKEALDATEKNPENVRQRLVSYREAWADLNVKHQAVLSLLEDDDESQDDKLNGAMNAFEDLIERTDSFLNKVDAPSATETAVEIQDLTNRQDNRYVLVEADLKDVEDQVKGWQNDDQVSVTGISVLRELLVSVETQLTIIEDKNAAILALEKDPTKKKKIDSERVEFSKSSRSRIVSAKISLAKVESELTKSASVQQETESVSVYDDCTMTVCVREDL